MPTLPNDGELFVIPDFTPWPNLPNRTNIRYGICTGGVTLEPDHPAEGWIWYKEADVEHTGAYGYPLAAFRTEKTPV